MWHWHPECVVEKDNSIVKTRNKKGNLAVIPVSQQNFDINFIKGQEEPEIQGWYSSEYNLFEPNIASFYTTNINESSTMVWLLLPSEKEMPEIVAEIISENDNGVIIEVKLKQNVWQLTIPYINSEDANLIQN